MTLHAHRRRLTVDTLLAILIPLLLLTACAKRPSVAAATVPVTSPSPSPGTAAPSAADSASASARVAAAPQPSAPAPSGAAPDVAARRPLPSEFEPASALTDIHFDFDRYEIRPGDARTLDGNARWMKAQPASMILIEGHADERGTDEYNLALGDRRARAAMSYLVAQGVQASRIILISYGEERPLCTERTGACWAKNRRAHFLMKRG